jgi:predicted nucleotide-binding protein (sugar kinase/HSP70/actin superfamily)
LDLPYYQPSFPGPEVLRWGQELAPEGSCLPFVLILGNMREALENGVDTLVMLGGAGPCRFGFFAYLAEQILQDAGYQFKLLKIDRGYNWEALQTIKKASGANWNTFGKGLEFGWRILCYEENLARLEREYLSRSKEQAVFKATIQKRRESLDKIATLADIKKLQMEIAELPIVKSLSPREEVLSIGLVGDIYTMLEPYANQQIEELLLSKNICVYKEMAVSTWLPNILLPWRKKTYKERLLTIAFPYLNDSVGGFGLETVAVTRAYSQQDLDGVIQLFPMGCMPEIVARSALGKISSDEDLPFLSITLDQHESGTGFLTRIEAFLELVEARKEKKADETEKLSKK